MDGVRLTRRLIKSASDVVCSWTIATTFKRNLEDSRGKGPAQFAWMVSVRNCAAGRGDKNWRRGERGDEKDGTKCSDAICS